MVMLNKDDILGTKDLRTKTINIPEWGGDVIISTMTALDRDEFEVAMINTVKPKSRSSIRASVAVRVIVDKNGNRLFSDEDAGILSGKSGVALTRVYDTAISLNRITDEDIDELAKN